MNGRIFFGLLLIIIGALFLAGQFTDINISRIISVGWPLIVIFCGFVMVFQPFTNRSAYSDEGVENKDKINIDVSFAGSSRKINSEKFTGGKAEVSFGELKLDLTSVKISDTAVLKVDVTFGSLVLDVPKDLKVVDNISAFAGDVDSRKRDNGTGPTLVLDGSVTFGNVEIR